MGATSLVKVAAGAGRGLSERQTWNRQSRREEQRRNPRLRTPQHSSALQALVTLPNPGAPDNQIDDSCTTMASSSPDRISLGLHRRPRPARRPREERKCGEISRNAWRLWRRKVELLEQLPARVGALESQVLQLRDEMRTEFSATRSELRQRVPTGARRLLPAALRAGLRQEIRDGDEETRRLMRVLHEEVLARIETLGRG